jgi:hypothetical protein
MSFSFKESLIESILVGRVKYVGQVSRNTKDDDEEDRVTVSN